MKQKKKEKKIKGKSKKRKIQSKIKRIKKKNQKKSRKKIRKKSKIEKVEEKTAESKISENKKIRYKKKSSDKKEKQKDSSINKSNQSNESEQIKKPEKIKEEGKDTFEEAVSESRNLLRKKLRNLPRIPTGITGFDKMANGGFEAQSINLVVGGSGSGKSIFSLQFLIEGIKRGDTGMYVTFEEKKEEVYINMKKLGWDLAKYEKSGKFIFLEYSPEKVKMMLDEGGGEIESLVLRHKIKRLVIDSITSFSLLFEDSFSKRQANLNLFDIIDKWECTTLLTVQHDPEKGKGGDLPSIEFEADSIINLYFIKVKEKRQRFIEILKMRGTNHSKETYSFEIKKGIKIRKKADIRKLSG